MPRARSHSAIDIEGLLLPLFWERGFEQVSIGDIVRETGLSRHALYRDGKDKRALFDDTVAAYVRHVVDPAIMIMRDSKPGFTAISNYFETQIALAETLGLPGRGCLIANSETEMAARDPAIRAVVTDHHDKLSEAFRATLDEACGARDQHALIAPTIATFAQGLWSHSRSVVSAEPLRRQVETFLTMMQAWLET